MISHRLLDLPASLDGPADVQVVAILDPLSSVAQRMVPVIQFLRDYLHADVKVYLNPRTWQCRP